MSVGGFLGKWGVIMRDMCDIVTKLGYRIAGEVGS